MTLSTNVNEFRRYAMISALVLAGFGPPKSQRSGGFSPDICFPQASLAQATCFTCSPNVRTPLNSPWVGLKFHLSSGMASANAMKSCEMSFQIKLMESGIVLGSGGRCCARPDNEFPRIPKAMNANTRLCIHSLRSLRGHIREAQNADHCMQSGAYLGLISEATTHTCCEVCVGARARPHDKNKPSPRLPAYSCRQCQGLR